MNTNTYIWTVFCKYKYKYKYLSETRPQINMLLYIKAIQVGKQNAYMCHSMQYIVIGGICVHL